jgi:DNA-binding NarL/FixJ family response regulator
MVGRDEEWNNAVDLLFGGEKGLVLAGAAGVGKTRFVSDLIEHARSLGYSVEMAVGSRSASTIPFASFAYLLGSGSHVLGRTEMLIRLEAEFARQTARHPLVICVDDAHLVDHGTAAVLHNIAAKGHGRLLLSVRTSADAPDAITRLWRDGHVTRIDVSPLASSAMEEIATQVLGGPVDTATKHRLLILSAGNPQFLTETIHAGRTSGALCLINGVWQWNGRPLVADRLEQLIGDRIAEVPRDLHVVLQALALAEPVPVSALIRMVGPTGVEALEVSGVVRTSEGSTGRLESRLTHPVYGEVIRAQVPRAVEVRVLSDLAQHLLAVPGVSEDDRHRAAIWRTESPEPIDVPLTISAARRALALHDFELSLRLARRVLQEDGGSEGQLIEAHALYWLDRFEDCATVLAGLDGTATDDQKVEATVVRSSALFWGLDDVELATRLIADRLKEVSGSAHSLILQGHLSSLLLWSGDAPEARRLCDLVLLDSASGPEARLRAAVPGALAAALDGRYEEVGMVAAANLPIAFGRLQKQPLAAGELTAVQAVAEWLCGDLTKADKMIRSLIEWSLEHDITDLIGIFSLLSGQVATARGDITSAVDDLREAVAVLAQHDPGRVLAWAWGGLAMALGQAGDGTGARAAAAEAERCARSATALLRPMIELGWAWADAADGATSLAVDRLVEVANGLVGRQMRAVELTLLINLARFGDTGSARARLAALSDELPSPTVKAALAFAAGLHEEDPASVDRASTDFEAWGAKLLAAEAAAESARLWRSEGRLGTASLTAERARRLLLLCPGAETPLMVVGRAALVDPLSTREREVATLAAAGSSNLAIAERLKLSERTIENHLARAFSKLGVNDRRQLTKVMSGGML